MNSKSLFFYLLSLISLVIAVILFFKWLDLKFLVPLAFGTATVIFFFLGSSASKKK